MIKMWAVPFAFASLAVISAPVLAQTPNDQAPDGPYVAMQGSVDGSPTTILVDEHSGASWYLGTVDAQGHVAIIVPLGSQVGTPTWIPIQVGKLKPSN
jgi:hypothetical protein